MAIHLRNSTEYELAGLSASYNLADGHAHHHPSPEEQAIIQGSAGFFDRAFQQPQREVEEAFLETFFRAAQQPTAILKASLYLSYSASTAILIIAQYLRETTRSVGLIHPTFDNIYYILRNSGVMTAPIDERTFCTGLTTDPIATKSDAIFLVLPNNPTGQVLQPGQFRSLVEFCHRHSKTLIVDFSFRFFARDMFWDQYQLLLDSGVDFACIEDTGKTWPTADLKTGIIACSQSIEPAISRIHSDLLLNVSPFVLSLLTGIINADSSDPVGAFPRGIVKDNRNRLLSDIPSAVAESAGLAPVSVEWFRIKGGLTGQGLWEELSSNGVYVLPGSHFFWSSPERGMDYFRVAMMRSPEYFAAASRVLGQTLRALSGNHKR